MDSKIQSAVASLIAYVNKLIADIQAGNAPAQATIDTIADSANFS